MKQYSRVSYAVRCQICAFLEINLSIPEIATRLGYNKSTIYREIKRNSFKNLSYQTDQAQRWSDKRRLRCRKKRLLKGDYLDLVVKKLKEDWSPQQISKRIYVGWTLAKNNYNNPEFKGIYFSYNRQKEANDRFIPMNKVVLKIMKKWVGERKDSEFVFTNQPQEVRDIVFRDGNNKTQIIKAPIVNSQHFSEDRFKALQRRLGIEKEKMVGAHGLRHTFASHYVMNGGNLYVLSKLMGHSSVKITEIYAHLAPEYLMDIERYVSIG